MMSSTCFTQVAKFKLEKRRRLSTYHPSAVLCPRDESRRRRRRCLPMEDGCQTASGQSGGAATRADDPSFPIDDL
jgi:hypothetical protein